MRTIKAVNVDYMSHTGEQLKLRKYVGKQPVWPGGVEIVGLRIRWAGGANGTFRVYSTMSDGTLNTTHIPQERIVDVNIEYLKEESKL